MGRESGRSGVVIKEPKNSGSGKITFVKLAVTMGLIGVVSQVATVLYQSGIFTNN